MDSTQHNTDQQFQPVTVSTVDRPQKTRDTGQTVLQYNWRSDRSLIPLIVDAVAANSGEETVLNAPPLHDVIDPDALDSLFAPTNGGTLRNDGQVRFEWADHHITLDATGVVSITRVEDVEDGF